ncbi:MAG: hypothetical protein ABI833_21890 [Acidobacteriota bacterium]
MRTILLTNFVWLFAVSAFAQDRNFPGALGAGLPPLHSSAPGLSRPGMSPRPHGGGFPHGVGYGYGYGFGGYAYVPGNVEPAPVVNSVVLMQQPSVPAPPEPIHSSIQNLKGDSEPSSNDEAPAFFVIVLKNGSRLAASVVWVQGNDARYVDGEGQGGRVPLVNVDRAATRELNRAHNLNLRLPPPAQ